MSNQNRAPGIHTGGESVHRVVAMKDPVFYPSGKLIVGSDSRDPTNSLDVRTLQAGMVLGKNSTSGKYAPSIIGALSVDYDASADTTEMTVAAATAVEIVRRIGASGTFKLTGAPTATGVVQTVTVTYSEVDVDTGVITVTALDVDVDEVHTITLDAAMTGGEYALSLYFDGATNTPIVVSVAWNSDWATTMAAINTAITAAATAWAGEASVGAVMTGTATEQVLTFSGVGVAGTAIDKLSEVDISGCTGPSSATVVETTTGVPASGVGSQDFESGAYVQDTDGTETPMCLIPDGSGIDVVNFHTGDSVDAALAKPLVGGFIRTASIVNFPAAANTTLNAWLKAQLRANGSWYVFDDDF